MLRLGKKILRTRFLALTLVMGLVCPSFSLIGVGLHYGLDVTQKMDNKLMEQTQFGNFKFSLNELTKFPDTLTSASVVAGKDIPVYINRKDWQNTGLNLGGKLYVDIIPFIDAVELSTNFGVWQYDGSIVYPSGISQNPNISSSSKLSDFFTYDTMSLNLKDILPNRFFWGVTKTPFAKLHCDATLRKYLLKIPPIIKTVKVYAGLGMSVDFATPMLSSKLIEDAIGPQLENTLKLSEMGPTLFGNPETMKKILNKIISELMTPHYGCHLAVGAMIKIPMIPIGFYIDGKYIILFDKLDKYVDIGGSGFLFNIGAALTF